MQQAGPLAQHGIVTVGDGEQERLVRHVAASAYPSSWNVTESVNLRDLATAGGELVHAERAYRSSQVVCTTQLRELGIKTIIDLRQAPVTCRAQHRNIRQAIRSAFKYCYGICFSGNSDSDLEGGGTPLLLPNPCWRCTSETDGTYGVEATVYHVDLLPTFVKLRVFGELPRWLQAKVLGCAVRKRNAEPLVAAAVANNAIMGYFKLYKIILDSAKKQVIHALQLYANANNYPILVHCIHGKDRTGLIVMLLYHICEVPVDIIIDDYAHSESLLREGRENRKLLGIQEHMTTDEIMSANAYIMRATIDYLTTTYGGVLRYLRMAGLSTGEMEAIRRNMTGLSNLSKRELDKRLNVVHT